MTKEHKKLFLFVIGIFVIGVIAVLLVPVVFHINL